MTQFQSYMAGVGLLVAGVGLAVTGALIHHDTLLGLGVGLITSGVAALGIPRPKDV